MRTQALFATALAVFVALPVFAGTVGSGLKPGDTVIPFHPEHISGPLAGTTDCFPCTYGNLPAVQAWVHNEDAKTVTRIIEELQEGIDKYKNKDFKAMLVMVVDKDSDKASAKKNLMLSVSDSKSKDVAVAIITKDNQAIKDYKINLDKDVKNTVFFYKNRKITNTMVNMKSENGACTGMCEHISSLLK